MRQALSPALTLFLLQTLHAQPASLQGVVTDALAKQPLAGAHIMVNPQQTGPHYGAVSTATGRFSIAGLPPGPYNIHPELNGYIVAGGTLVINLKPGENELNILLTPRAVMRGRVTDEFGDPIPGAQIQAIPISQGKTLIEIPVFGGVTDDRGEYRMSGPPGKYYISAERANTDIYSTPHEVRTDGSQSPFYVVTWFPSSEAKTHATAVEAIGSREISGIDIRLISRRAVSVSGIVSGRPEGKLPTVVRMWSAAAAPEFELVHTMRATGAAPDNTFSILGLTPGDYMIEAEYFGAVTLRSSPIPIHAGLGENNGIRLSLVPGEELTGKLESPGTPDSESRTVTLQPVSPVHRAAGLSATGPVGPDGAFHIPNVFPGKYTMTVEPMPPNGYLAENTLDLTRGIGSRKAKIEIRLDGATVSGTIANTQPRLTVILERAAEDPERRTFNLPPNAGQYSFTGVRPGKYRIFAVGTLVFLADPDVSKKLFDQAEEIEIHGGDRIVRDAKILTQ